MGDRHINRHGTRCQQQLRCAGDAVAGAGHIVQQHHLSTGQNHVGQCNLDVTVTTAQLVAYRVIKAMAVRRHGDPLRRFYIGANKLGPLPLRRNPVRQQGRPAQHHRLRQRHGFL